MFDCKLYIDWNRTPPSIVRSTSPRDEVAAIMMHLPACILPNRNKNIKEGKRNHNKLNPLSSSAFRGSAGGDRDESAIHINQLDSRAVYYGICIKACVKCCGLWPGS